MNITVLGAGPVGTNLAIRFAQLGHRITFGARDPSSDKVSAAVARIEGATAVALGDVPGDADLVVLAVPFAAIGDVLSAVGDLSGTVLVDATNTVGMSLPDGATTIVDVIRAQRPEAVVVKAFNTIGAEAFLDGHIGGQPLFLPVAGPKPAAEAVADLARAIGFDALVIGDESTVELLEAHARLWIHLAFRVVAGRDFGFARLTRTPLATV
jgi:8-hydroxy-5-deazaflavin:NADPH oxidoreductase